MGDGHHEPPEAPPGRGAPLKRRPVDRAALPVLGLILAGIVVLWGAAGAVVFRTIAARHERAVADAVAGVRTRLEDAGRELLREARILARDEAVVDGAQKGDWATLALRVSPRLRALTLDEVADLVVVVDATGAPLLQVPTSPRLALSEFGPGARASAEPGLTLLVSPEGPYLVAVAPLTTGGTVVVGRRVERVDGHVAERVRAAAVIAVAGDRLIGTGRPGTPATGWESATRAGRLTIRGEPWVARPLARFRDAALWALVREEARPEVRWLWLGLFGSLAIALAGGIAAWIARGRHQGVRPPAGPILPLTETDKSGRLEVLVQVTRTLTATLSLDDVFTRVVDAAVSVFASSVCRLWLVDDDGEHVSPRAAAGATGSLEGLSRLRIGQGLAGTVVATGAPLTVVDVVADPRLQNPERVRAAGLVSFAGVPLVAGHRVLGALMLATREPHEYTPEELEFLASLAGQAAIAIENARLYQRAEDRAQKLTALSTLTGLMASSAESREVFEAIAMASTKLLRAKVSHVWVNDATERLLRIEGRFGVDIDPDHDLMDTPSIGYGQGVVGRVFESRAPEYIADIQEDPRFINRRLATEAGLHSYAGIPLVAGDQAVGVLSVIFVERREFTPEERELMRLLGNHAAVAIDNARRFADERTRQAYLSALLEINRKISAMAPPETLLSVIAEEATKLLNVDNAGFRLVDGDELVVAGLAGTASQTMLRPRIKIGESFSGRVVAEGHSIIADIESVPGLIPEHLAADRRLGYTTWLGVPLKVGDRTTGVFAFRGRRAFTTRDRELAEAFARQAAIAIEQARLHRETTQQAQRMGALVDLGRLLSETLDPDLVGQRIADSIRTLVAARTSALYRLEPVSGDLVAVAVSGDAGPAFGRSIVFPRGTGVSGVAVREQRIVFTPNLLTDPRITLTPDTRSRIEVADYRAVLAIPLVVRDCVIGALGVGDLEGRVFDADEIRLAQAFADQAGLALENARLYSDAMARRREAEELAHVAATLTESLDVAAVGQRIVESVLPLFRVRSSGIRLLRPDGSLEAIARSGGSALHSPPGDVQPSSVGVSGRTVATGRPVILRDVLADPGLILADAVRRRVEDSGDGAILAVPLSVKGKTIGALSIADRTGREFSESEVALLQGFADQAALALENARLYEAQEARAIRLRALARLNNLVSSSLELDEVLGEIARAAAELVQAPHVSFWIADETARTLAIRALSDEALGADFPDRSRHYGHGGVGWIAVHRQLLYIPDVSADPRFVATEWARAHGLTSFLGIPILLGETLLGVLTLIDRKPFAFGSDQQDLLDSFVAQATVAIRNARLYQEAREYGDRLRALEEVNRLVSSSLQMDEVLHNIAAAVARFFDAPYVTVWRLDPGDRLLRRALSYGDSQLTAELPDGRELGAGVVGWVALHNKPIIWTDLEADPRGVGAGILVRHGLPFVSAYPIALGDRVLGVFAVNRAAPTPVTPDTATLVGSLAAQAAVALDNARLYSETAIRLEETRALLDVAEILNSTLDPKQLLKRVAIKIAQVCRVDRCAVELWDGDRVIPLMAQFADGRTRPDLWKAFTTLSPYAPGQVPAHARAIETRRPVVIDDTRDTELLPRAWIEAFELKACMVVPLIRQDQVIGVMNLDYCDRPERFDGSQADLAMAIAGQLALSLENTRLYSELQERLRETTTLLAVGQFLSQSGPAYETMRRVAREVARAFGADLAVAYALDPERKGLLPLAGYHVPKFLLERFRQNLVEPLRLPMLSMLREGRAVFSADAMHDTRFDTTALEGWPPHSLLFAPTIARGEVIGGIALAWWRTGRSFTPGEIRLIEGVAAQVGLAMENAELSRQTQIKLMETQTLLAMSRALASTLDFDALARGFLRRVTQAIQCDSVGLWMLDAPGEFLEPAAGYHLPPEYLPALRQLRLPVTEHVFCVEAARTGRAVFSPDAGADPRIAPELLAAAPHRSQLFVPIVLNDRMIGAFVAVWWDSVRQLTADKVALMEAIASQAGVALENVRLFLENRRQVEELSVLHELSQAVTGQLDRAALIDAIQTQIARVLDVGRMVVILRDDERQDLEVAFRMREGVRDMHAPLRYPVRSVGLVSVVLETGRPLRTEDYLAECERRGVTPVQESGELRRWMGIPMTAGNTVLGVLALRGGPRPFTASDERLLTNIAHLAALALRSAQLFEERTRAYGELAAAQDQLVRTEKLRALGEMASGVAHDFNNLLASILGRAQLALRRVQEPQIRQWLQVIERSALDGAQTVRRLQEFTRIRRDQPLVAVDLNEVVRDALEITQSRWREEPARRGVAVDVRTALAPVPAIAGDPAELREALTNLILNAVDAMPSGGTLTVTTGPAGDEIALTVTDTGVGMPETVREKIFDPFFTTKGPQGTGLGLSMTYGILSRHGARITVDSEPGRGSTFRLTFAPSGEAGQPAPDAPRSPDAPPMRCLVVDDEAVVGRMLGDVLETGGHHAVVVTEGEEAVARFQAEPFDVVFTDLAMPRMSGWQVARAIKEIRSDVAVYLVTGFGVELSAEERRAHRVDAVLVKPLQIEDILAAVAQAARKPGRAVRTEDP